MKNRRTLVSAALLLWLGAPVLILAQNYVSEGKRDPFEGPKEAQAAGVLSTPPPLDKRPPGLTGLTIGEVTVAGLAGNHQEKVVILKGVDGVSYLARKGSRLYDGHLDAIESDEVAFLRETPGSKGVRKTERVVKRLYTEDK